MEAVFLRILNISITAGWIVLAVMVARFLLKKAPKWIIVLMWGLVGVRLVCPFSLESVFSLIPSAQPVPSDILYTDTPAIHTGVEAFNSVVNPVISESLAPSVGASVNPMQVITFVASVIWIAGIAVMLVYTVISYLRIFQKVREAVTYKDNIRVCDQVDTPFILGIIRPRIYLPSAMGEQDMEYVIAHEKDHLKRHDHWWKPLGFLLLTIYWFNPVIWIAYILLCRDIELACDEKVIRDMGIEIKKPYSNALINCSVPRSTIAACPLAFGEVGVKVRVKSVLNYKKPAFWIIVVAAISCIVVAVCFLTNPKTTGSAEKNIAEEQGALVTKWFDYLEAPDEMNWDGGLEINIPEFPNVTFRWYPEKMETVTEREIIPLPLYTGMPIWSAYFCDLTGDGLPELCSSLSFGSGIIDERIIIYDYANGISYELEERGTFDYILRLNDSDGQLYVDKKNYNSNELVTSGRLVYEDNCIQVESVEANVMKLSAQQRELMDKYPEYFELDSTNGLDVYVWQMAENYYSFGLLPHTEEQRDWLSTELLNLQGVDADKMRQILSTYNIDENDINIIPWQNPISSYLGDLWIISEGESLEEKQKAYIESVRNMLFGE